MKVVVPVGGRSFETSLVPRLLEPGPQVPIRNRLFFERNRRDRFWESVGYWFLRDEVRRFEGPALAVPTGTSGSHQSDTSSPNVLISTRFIAV